MRHETPGFDFGDASASLELALHVAEYFELSRDEAQAVAGEVGGVVAAWRDAAANAGIGAREIARMASAFEHADLAMAIRTSGRPLPHGPGPTA